MRNRGGWWTERMIRVLKKRKKNLFDKLLGGEEEGREENNGRGERRKERVIEKCGTRKKGYANNKKLTIGEEKQGRNFFFRLSSLFCARR